MPRWYLTRHPLVANILLPPLIFIVLYRLPFDMPNSWRRSAHNFSNAVSWTGVECLVAAHIPLARVFKQFRRLDATAFDHERAPSAEAAAERR